jgi:hypothetical protein
MEKLCWVVCKCTAIVSESSAEEKMYRGAGLTPHKNYIGNLAALGQRVTP